MDFCKRKVATVLFLACLLGTPVLAVRAAPPVSTPDSAWESLAGVEAAAVLLGWFAGSSEQAPRVIGYGSIAGALLAPGTGPGTTTLRIGLLALGAYNFDLDRDDADRDERRRGNFWAVNAIALAAWATTGGEVLAFDEPAGGFSLIPALGPDSVGLAARYRC
jgi:hypothetical protein